LAASSIVLHTESHQRDGEGEVTGTLIPPTNFMDHDSSASNLDGSFQENLETTQLKNVRLYIHTPLHFENLDESYLSLYKIDEFICQLMFNSMVMFIIITNFSSHHLSTVKYHK
jgi:hypothetical protein